MRTVYQYKNEIENINTDEELINLLLNFLEDFGFKDLTELILKRRSEYVQIRDISE